MPDLQDGVFDSSVVLICEHGDTGAMGFIVNKATEFSVQEIFQQLGLEVATALDPEIPVMTGGPVEPQRGFLLTNAPLSDDAVEVLDGLYLASSPDVLPLSVDALNQKAMPSLSSATQAGQRVNLNKKCKPTPGSMFLGMPMSSFRFQPQNDSAQLFGNLGMTPFHCLKEWGTPGATCTRL
jgi:Putative transcriptional regulator